MNKKICIIGLGYVGLPLAAAFAKKYTVVGFDINEPRVEELNNDFDRTLELNKEQLVEVKDNITYSCDLEDIKDKYTLSLLIGSRVKFRSLSLGLRYERGLNNREILIINANGVELDDANVDLTTNKLSLNLSYDIPYGLFKKKNN